MDTKLAILQMKRETRLNQLHAFVFHGSLFDHVTAEFQIPSNDIRAVLSHGLRKSDFPSIAPWFVDLLDNRNLSKDRETNVKCRIVALILSGPISSSDMNLVFISPVAKINGGCRGANSCQPV